MIQRQEAVHQVRIPLYMPEIVDAVGDKLTVLFDSEVRTGVDIMKAIYLGAKAVLIGRPWVYGLGIGRMLGAKNVMRDLLAVSDPKIYVRAFLTDMVGSGPEHWVDWTPVHLSVIALPCARLSMEGIAIPR